MFDECKIKFYAEEEYIKNSPNLLPVPTKLNIPSWFKKLDHKIKPKGQFMGIFFNRSKNNKRLYAFFRCYYFWLYIKSSN